MTPVIAASASARRPWAVWLIGLYVVLLLALPVDVGLSVAGSVLTPARIVLGMAVLVALLEWRSVLPAVRRVPRLIWVAWAAFLLATLVTASIWPSTASWVRYGSLVFEGPVVFVLVSHAANAPGGVRAVATVFAVTMVAVAAVVLVLAAFGLHYDHVLSGLTGSKPAPDILARYGFERQAGPFRGATYFGIWLTAGCAMLLPALDVGTGTRHWLALGGWLVLAVSALTLTGSRLAMTMVFALPGVYFLIRGKRTPGLAGLLAAAVVALGVSLIPANEAIESSTSLRVAALGASFDAVRMHPLFGWGLLNDMHALGEILGVRNYVDNTYLSIAVEMGLIGLGAFLVLAFSIVLSASRGWRTPQGLTLTLALLAVLGMAVLVSVLQATQGYAAFFVLGALAVAAASRPYSATSGGDLASQL